ncbi:MAG: sensor histidine kinase [Pseudobdellovibrio sp.]
MSTIQVLVYILGGILAISSVYAGLLWYSFREKVLKNFFLFWICGCVSFVAQGVFSELNAIHFSLFFLAHFLCFYYLFEISRHLLGLKISWKHITFLASLSLALSLVLFAMKLSYSISAIPGVLFISCALFYFSYLILRSPNRTRLDVGYALLLITNSFHVLDYPYMRPREDLAIFGFAVAITFYFIYSIFIPLYVIKKIDTERESQLEDMVISRTDQWQVANQKLSETNTILEYKYKEIDKMAQENQALLNILVHDISNPMQIIFNCMTGLKKHKEPDSQAKYLYERYPKLVRAMNSIDEILTTVRNFHSAKLGKISVNFVSIRLDSLLSEVVNLLEEKLAMKNIKISYDSNQCSNIFIRGEASWLKNQVLMNLLTNAIKFSPENSVIDIIVRVDNNKVAVQIRDYGVGIPDDLRNKIFELDQQTTRLGTSGEKGTGLGLPIVKKYLEMMDGKITLVELSKSELGTCFELELTGERDQQSA